MRAALAALCLLAGITPGPARAREHPVPGINFAGAEFNGKLLPGRPGVDYTYPTTEQLEWAAARGFRLIRLPVRWERLQPALEQPLDADELARVRAVTAAASVRGLSVVIDVHNYAMWHSQKIGSDAVPVSSFADLWRRLATEFRGDPRVIFGLMNEPQIDRTGDWRRTWAGMAQAAIDAIRATRARNLVLVSGAGWAGAHDFAKPGKNGIASNAEALATLHDPAQALAFEVHQYLDGNFSGTHSDCPRADEAEALLQPFTDWLRAGRRRGVLGEFGASARPECLEGLRRMLAFMDANGDVWMGWTYWAAGSWWSKNYPFSIHPRDGVERPQTAVLAPRP